MTRAAWAFVAGSCAAWVSVDVGRGDAKWAAFDLLGLVCALLLAKGAKR